MDRTTTPTDTEDLAAYRDGYCPLYGNPTSKTPTSVVPRSGADIRSADRALRRLFLRHEDTVFSVVLHRFANADLDRALVEEAYADALHRRSFAYDLHNPTARFGTWLATVVGNAVAKELRRAATNERRWREGTKRVEHEVDAELSALIDIVLNALDEPVLREIAKQRVFAPLLGQKTTPRRVIETTHGLSTQQQRTLETHTRSLLAEATKTALTGYNR